jgi:hypothetical protein
VLIKSIIIGVVTTMICLALIERLIKTNKSSAGNFVTQVVRALSNGRVQRSIAMCERSSTSIFSQYALKLLKLDDHPSVLDALVIEGQQMIREEIKKTKLARRLNLLAYIPLTAPYALMIASGQIESWKVTAVLFVSWIVITSLTVICYFLAETFIDRLEKDIMNLPAFRHLFDQYADLIAADREAYSRMH